MERTDYTQVAGYIVNAAGKLGFISGRLSVVPELAELERELFIKIAAKVMEHTGRSTQPGLDQMEVLSMFTFVSAKAAEAVTSWLGNNAFEIRLEGLFDGRVPFTVEERLGAYIKARGLAEAMYGAFSDWRAEAGGHNHHPVLPLLEALKWTFRISAGLAVEFLEKNREEGSN